MNKMLAFTLIIMMGLFIATCGCTNSDTTNGDVSSTQAETEGSSANATTSEETTSPSNTETESENQTQMDSAVPLQKSGLVAK